MSFFLYKCMLLCILIILVIEFFFKVYNNIFKSVYYFFEELRILIEVFGVKNCNCLLV